MTFARSTVVIFFALILPLCGSTSHFPDNTSRKLRINSFSEQVHKKFAAGEFVDCVALARSSAIEARLEGDHVKERGFLNNTAICQMSLFQYRDALISLTDARILAEQAVDRKALAALNANISSLYSQTGNFLAAQEAAQLALSYQDALASKQRASLLTQVGVVRADMGHLAEAEPIFLRAVDTALDAGNPESAAQAWDFLGFYRRKAGRIAQADSAATEGLRLRKTFHLSEIASSYMNLGAIRANQGDLDSAIVLLNQAEISLHLPANRTHSWHVYMERGRVRLQAGQLVEAFGDLRKAVALARIWRADIVANDANRTSAEAKLAELYGLMIDCGNRLYLVNHDAALIVETFEAASESRATSLRALVPQKSDWRHRLPQKYWELLANLQSAEASWLSAGQAFSPNMRALQSRLAEMEAGVGAPPRADSDLATENARLALGSDSALLSFRLGDTQSWLWTLTADSISLTKLPSRREITCQIGTYSQTLTDHSRNNQVEAAVLSRMLFGSISKAVTTSKRWLLDLDEDLFDLPFAALPAENNEPLIARHSLQIASSAIMLRKRAETSTSAKRFLGVGDPVYNEADARVASRSSPWLAGLSLARYTQDNQQPAFARLWGTAQEIQISAQSWGTGQATLLTGKNASSPRFWAEIAKQPDVIHIATHILEQNEKLQTGWIALSRRTDGQLDYLTPAEISARSITAKLVVLSGCSSGKAEVQKASGLMGLTRAWIAAGAGAVLATRWPTVDDNGVFFESFYRHLKIDQAGGPASALRQASLEMIKSGTWRAAPSFWAGYFLVSND